MLRILNSRWLLLFCISFFGIYKLSNPFMAYGDMIQDPGRLLLDEQRKYLREEKQAQEFTDIEVSPIEKMPEIIKESAQFFNIKSLFIKGSKIISEEEKSKILKPYAGPGKSLTDLENLIIDINNFFIKERYVTTRAHLEPETLEEGIVTVQVTEGIIEGIQADKKSAQYAFPKIEGQVLRAEDLEQGLDNINRIKSHSAIVGIWPGEKIGGSLIKVEYRKTRPYRASIGFDNYGDDTTGRTQVKFRGELDDLLGLNDFLLFSASKSLKSTSVAWHWDTALSYLNFGYDGSYSCYKYDLATNTQTQLHGQSSSHAWKLGYLFHRSRQHKFSAYTRLGIKRPMRKLKDIKLETHALTTLELGIDHQYRGEKASLLSSLYWTQGLSIMGAHKDDPSISRNAPHAQFDKVEMSVYFSLEASEKFRINSQILAQYGFQGLPGEEKLSLISHQSGVRGFKNQSFAFDDGTVLRNELEYGHLQVLEKQNNYWALFLLLDVGVGRNKGAKSGERMVSGGLGLRFAEKHLFVEVSYSRPLYTSRAYSKNTGDIMFSINMRF